MGKRKLSKSPKPSKPSAKRTSWRWVMAGGILVVAIAAFWWFSEAQDPVGGTPRLAVDHTEIDLGYFHLGKWAKAVFTLTNTGDGMLRIVNEPRVEVVKGC